MHIIRDGDKICALMGFKGDESVDIMKSRSRLRWPGATLTGFYVPLKIQCSPVKSGGSGINHGGFLPGRKQFYRVYVRKPCLYDMLKTFIAYRRIITESSPQHPMIPVFIYLDLTRRFGVTRQKLSSPNILIRAVIITTRHVIGNILNKLAHKIRRAPAKIVNIIITQGPDGF